MEARNSTRLLAAAAAAMFVAACESTAPMSPQDVAAPDFGAAVTLPPTTDRNEVAWVCKDAPSGSFDFTVTADSVLTAPMPNILNAAPTIAAGNCTKVAAAGNGHLITVTEAAEPGYIFDRIEAFYVPLGSTSLVPDASGIVYTPTITRSLGDLGRVFIFYNVLPPSTDCTLTLGYWKTHNATFPGGAPVDPTWAQLPAAEGTTFYLSGMSWYQVFWTTPAGNAYYNLAHQYMAAKLNILAGADDSAVAATITAAEALFAAYTPAQVAALAKSSSVRAQFLSLALTLDDYNNGLIGPGHCSDGPVD